MITGMPDWQPIVNSYLSRFPTITSADVDRTEHWASNASMFHATGSWRAKVVQGGLHVKFIRAHSHWTERASVLRIVMLALDGLRREGVSLPDFELVYAHNDKDPTPDSYPKCPRQQRRQRGKTRGAEPPESPCAGAPIPLFTNGRAARRRDGATGAGGLPLPDFTWAGAAGESAVLAVGQLTVPRLPGECSPGSWLRHALGAEPPSLFRAQ